MLCLLGYLGSADRLLLWNIVRFYDFSARIRNFVGEAPVYALHMT